MTRAICLISSGQPSANPRLVKEATSLFEAGYDVIVIYCPISPWADPHDLNLFARYPQIRWITVGSHPQKNRIRNRFARLRRKFYECVFKYFGYNFLAAERSLVLFSQELKQEACNTKADLYIGHNLGSLPAVVTAARKYKAKAIFDFEDYHRGEHLPDTIQTKIVKAVEEKYVPYLSYATTAAPLISDAYKEHFPALTIYTINNCFSLEYSPHKLPKLPENPLKLFWFSQYVGRNRGLEQVIEAIGKTGKKEIQLTLLGNCSDEMKEYFLNEAEKYGLISTQLEFIPPVAEKDIVIKAAQHHIGLACEPGRDVNNSIALSNKIFMYLLAGNAIIFSSTKAQELFFQQNKSIGSLFRNNNINELSTILSYYFSNPEHLEKHRKAAFEMGKSYNWDKEKEQFLTLLKHHL